MSDIGDKAQELKGRVKEAAGDLTDDDRLEEEGRADRLAGQAKQKLGDVKEKAGDLIDKAKDKLTDDDR